MKSKASIANSQVKSSLKQLHKLGLYDPKHPRRAPTKYAKSLVKKYTEMGVLGDRPTKQVIKIPKSAIASIGDEFATARTRKTGAVIVPKQKGSRTFYSKKKGRLIHKRGVYEFYRYHDSQILMRGGFPSDLKPGERIAVPQGNGWRIFNGPEGVADEIGKYALNDTRVHFWQYPYIVLKD